MIQKIEALIAEVKTEITKVGTNHDKGYRLGRAVAYFDQGLKSVKKAQGVTE